MARRRMSVFTQETIPSLVDRYPGTGISVPVDTGVPLPVRDPVTSLPLNRVEASGTFVERFSSYARGKVDNFAQCEARMNQLHEENAWLNEKLTNLTNRIDDFQRNGFGGGWNGGWNGRYNGVGYPNGVGYNNVGYNGYNGGYNGYLDGRESTNYMDMVRDKERRNIGLEKDRVELSLSAQRHHGRAERSAVFEDRQGDRDWGGDVPPGGMYRGKPEYNDEQQEGPKEGRKLEEMNFTRVKPAEEVPKIKQAKRSRKISSFKL